MLSTSTRRGPTLFSLLDRTRTHAGRDALRAHLAAPAADAAAVVALQQAHRELADDPRRIRVALDRAGLDGLERYLASRWQFASTHPRLTRVAQRVWRHGWFRRYLDDVSVAQAGVLALLAAAEDVSQRLTAAAAVVLREMGERLARQLAEPAAQRLRGLASGTSMSHQLEFDELARETARASLEDLIAVLGRLEAMWSLGVATAEHRWSYPTPGAQLQIDGLIHPFLGPQAVAIDLRLDAATRVCFVTGPNMAGKSTFLKATGIAALLAHAGCGVPAAAMSFPAARALLSSVQIVDNLSAGESFYLAEVRRIRTLAAAIHDHGAVIAVLDEPFRGTNVHDAADATLAIITRLIEHPGALVFVASHIAEIGPSLASDPRVCLRHFAADLAGERPRFDYRLRPGLSAQRLGMTLLAQEGVLDLLARASTVPEIGTPVV